MIDQEADGAIAVTGTVDPKNEVAFEEAWEAASKAKGDVVMILTHASQAANEQEVGRSAEMVGSLHAIALAVIRSLDQRENMLELIEQMSPASIPSRPAVLQARRNSEARAALLEEFEGLTASEVADLAGSAASNRSALAARWRKEGRIFAVANRSVQYYPVFQFGDDFRPLPAIASVLETLRREPMSEWEIALWFTSRNGWLDDRRPVDLLQADPVAVVEAAGHEVAAIAG